MRYAKRNYSSTKTRSTNRAVVQKKRKSAKISKLRLNPVVAKLVDRRVRSAEETHYRTFKFADATGVQGTIAAGTPSVSSNAGSWPVMLPTVAAGDNADNRNGNELRVKSLKFEINIRTQVEGPMYVRVIIASSRKFRAQDNTVSPTLLTDMCNSLIRTNGSAVDFNGTMDRLYDPVNRENHIVHYDKILRINNEEFVNIVSGDTVTYRQYIRQLVVRMKTKNMKWRYNVTADEVPNNFAPCLYVGTVNPNSPSSTSTRAVSVFGMTKLSFYA